MMDAIYNSTATADAMKGKYLTFTLGKEAYGIEIRYVTEIIGMQNITEVPDLKDYVKGIINLRGKIIPLIDVRIKFKKPSVDYNDRTCIVVVEMSEISVGLIVDTVSEVINIPSENIVPPPDGKTGFSNKYIIGIGKVSNEVKLLIDCEKLLSMQEIEELSDLDIQT